MKGLFWPGIFIIASIFYVNGVSKVSNPSADEGVYYRNAFRTDNGFCLLPSGNCTRQARTFSWGGGE